MGTRMKMFHDGFKRDGEYLLRLKSLSLIFRYKLVTQLYAVWTSAKYDNDTDGSTLHSDS